MLCNLLQVEYIPQQTYFDPTASKIVRFATRNATPSIAKPGNRVEANLKQMYAMMYY